MSFLFEIDEIDEIENINTNTQIEVKTGDLWQLGEHRLLCGDCTIKENIDLLMNGNKADMVFTDPPYGVNYLNKNDFLNEIGKGNSNQNNIINDNLDKEKTKELWYKAFINIKSILNDYSCFYFCSPQSIEMIDTVIKSNLLLKQIIIWNKNNHVLGRSDYNYKHEPILYGWFNKHRFYGNGKMKTTVWDIPKPLKNDLHLTMKPIELIVNAILNSTLENMIVYDCFLGSGSTLIACEHTKRKCYGMEIDEHYCGVIIERWQKYTNKKAIKLN